MSSMQKDLLKSHLPHHKPDLHNLNFEPLPWNNFFDKKEILEIENNKYCVYSVGTKGPILYLIHGGGFSSLSWALFAHEITKLIDCRCIAVDLRGHGETKTCNDDVLSIENLTNDAANVMNHLFSQLGKVDIVLVGHSMGGAIAVHLANLPKSVLHFDISGLIVVDVVEGTALESLGGMQGFLRSRPKYFELTKLAIEWTVKTGQIKNVDSARVSVPGQLEKIDDPGPEYFKGGRQTPLSASYTKLATKFDAIPENVEEQAESKLSTSKPPLPSAASPIPSPYSSSNASPVCGSSHKNEEHPKTIYVWRAHLERTEKYWEGWFKGLSNMFVHTPLPKLIVLAGVDHLDKELTIGQMQGKFQMAILAKCGHSVQEDLPEEMAEIVASFLTKHKMANFLNPHFAPLQASC